MNHKKSQFLTLEGLRGIAAMVVVWYHIFEAYDCKYVYHGFLSVDFFFVLSGFVMAYAYDDRWGSISVKEFLLKRVLRLQPMLILGSILGASLFYVQIYEPWKTAQIGWGSLTISTLMNMFLIPSLPTQEIRGIGEMYPLNGPSWSLFFEYIAYVLYGFLLRKFSTKWLKIWVGAMALGISIFAVFGGLGLGVGWTLEPMQFLGGSLRVLFSFSAGLLLFRLFEPKKIKLPFILGALLLILIGLTPSLSTENSLLGNTFFELLCVLFLFPTLVYASANAEVKFEKLTKICKFLGNISYPLYLVHYPFIYWYYGWVKDENLPFSETYPWALALFFGSILLAYLAFRFFDKPLRDFLQTKFKLKV